MGHARSTRLTIFGIVMGMALAGCPDPLPPPPPSKIIVEPQGTSLLVQVFRTDGAPVDGATVSLGESTQQTDSNGNTLFENLSGGSVVAQVRAPGFAPRTVVTELMPGIHGIAAAALVPFEPPITFDAEAGATLQSKGMQVIIPPGSLRDENGQVVTGEAQAYIAPIDPSTDAINGAPGPFVGISAGSGGSVDIETGFMAEISLTQNERPLQLAPGAVATLRFDLAPAFAASVTPGTRVPAWWFDLAAGAWREEGTGLVEASPEVPGKLVWVAQVSHFTWWNADRPMERACINVLLRDSAGQPLSGRYIQLDGIDYEYTAHGLTDSSGNTCVIGKVNGNARVSLYSDTSAQAVTVTPTVSSECGSGSCVQVTLTTAATSCGAPGTRESCSYTGPAGTENVGACRAGVRFCDGVSWGQCSNQVLPSNEVCDGRDNNCDGQLDEGNPGGGASCLTGQPGTCGSGTKVCKSGAFVCAPTTTPSNEVCDGKDNNCNGQADEGNPGGGASCLTGQPGTCASGTKVCNGGTFACAPVTPPSTEVCDGKDNNCNGQTDEGNPGAGTSCNTGEPGVCAQGSSACSGGALVCSRAVAPSTEVCDGLDNNCDGQTDEGNPGAGAACSTGQPGVCAQGSMTCRGGGLVCSPTVASSAEVCDGLDNNCDGQVDEGNPGAGAACNTGQLGVCAQGSTACVEGAVVCNRASAPSTEVCDGQDNNCNGQTDEGNPGGGAACNTGQSGVCAQGTITCNGGALVCRADQSVTEVCDGVDNDCDGQIDEPDTCPAGTTYFTYSTKDTTSATRNTTDRSVLLEAGQTIEVGTCMIPRTESTGDSYLRLFSPSNTQAAENDEGADCTDGSSFLTYTVPAGAGGTYVIRAGCFAENICSGTVGYRIP